MADANIVLDFVGVLVWPLLLIVVALLAGRFLARRYPSRAETPDLRAGRGWRAESDDRVAKALEDSQWLAALGAGTPGNPAIHLQQAVHIVPSTYRECAKQIYEGVRRGRVVILDLADSDASIAARVVDFCGATALITQSVLQQLSSTVLMVVPPQGESAAR